MPTRVSPSPEKQPKDSSETQTNACTPSQIRRRSVELKAQRLAASRVAGADDRESLASAGKNDIQPIRTLGEGAFGIVDLVTVAQSGKHASHLLCVRKKLLKATEKNPSDPARECALNEACQQCKFVVQMWSQVVGLYDYTLLLEYCPYGNLESLLQVVSAERSMSHNACLDLVVDRLLRLERHAGLREEEARFYAACAILGLEEMHNLNIMHRDIKPANCLITDKRYLKLSDLGLARQMEGRNIKSIAGTPCYMAPEVVHCHDHGSSGYSFPADVWSMGMVIWECVEGMLPKWAPLSWYWSKTPTFPDTFSTELRSLLTGMLEKEPSARLSLKAVKGHPWFAGMDWAALQRQEVVPPAPHELEEVHLHDNYKPYVAHGV